MNGSLLTVAELAAALADTTRNGDLDRVHRLLRHWGMLRILNPAGAEFPGRGRARSFTRETAFEAALLLELAKNGFPISVLRAVLVTLHERVLKDPKYFTLWKAAIAGKEPVDFGCRFRELSDTNEVEGEVMLLPRGYEPEGSPRIAAQASTWLDLTALFQPVRQRLS
jgi:hypothetical protein